MTHPGVAKLNQYYGESHTLWDIDARRAGGLLHVPDGPQRRRQDDAAQLPHGPRADPESGKIAFDGHGSHGRAGPKRARRSGIGYVPQGREIFPLLTVEENLRVGLPSARPAARAAAGHLAAARRAELVFELFPC